MGVKGSWSRGLSSSFCIRNCDNRKNCDQCYKFSHYIPATTSGASISQTQGTNNASSAS